MKKRLFLILFIWVIQTQSLLGTQRESEILFGESQAFEAPSLPEQSAGRSKRFPIIKQIQKFYSSGDQEALEALMGRLPEEVKPAIAQEYYIEFGRDLPPQLAVYSNISFRDLMQYLIKRNVFNVGDLPALNDENLKFYKDGQTQYLILHNSGLNNFDGFQEFLDQFVGEQKIDALILKNNKFEQLPDLSLFDKIGRQVVLTGNPLTMVNYEDLLQKYPVVSFARQHPGSSQPESLHFTNKRNRGDKGNTIVVNPPHLMEAYRARNPR